MDSGEIALVLSIISTVVAFLAHLHLRSKCCGKESSLDITTITPPLLKPILAPK